MPSVTSSSKTIVAQFEGEPITKDRVMLLEMKHSEVLKGLSARLLQLGGENTDAFKPKKPSKDPFNWPVRAPSRASRPGVRSSLRSNYAICPSLCPTPLHGASKSRGNARITASK